MRPSAPRRDAAATAPAIARDHCVRAQPYAPQPPHEPCPPSPPLPGPRASSGQRTRRRSTSSPANRRARVRGTWVKGGTGRQNGVQGGRCRGGYQWEGGAPACPARCRRLLITLARLCAPLPRVARRVLHIPQAAQLWGVERRRGQRPRVRLWAGRQRRRRRRVRPAAASPAAAAAAPASAVGARPGTPMARCVLNPGAHRPVRWQVLCRGASPSVTPPCEHPWLRPCSKSRCPPTPRLEQHVVVTTRVIPGAQATRCSGRECLVSARGGRVAEGFLGACSAGCGNGAPGQMLAIHDRPRSRRNGRRAHAAGPMRAGAGWCRVRQPRLKQFRLSLRPAHPWNA